MDTASATSEKPRAMLDAAAARSRLTAAAGRAANVESASASADGGDARRAAAAAAAAIKKEAGSPEAATSCSDRSDQCSPTAAAATADAQLPGGPGAALSSDSLLGFDAAAAGYGAMGVKDLPFDARLLCDPSWGTYESPQSVYAMLLGSSAGHAMPPPPISTSGLLPSPTASSFLLHQLQQQQQQHEQLELHPCGLPPSGDGAGGSGSGSGGGGSGSDASALLSPFYAGAPFGSSLLSPHPHHVLLSPLHSSMGLHASGSSASASATASSSPAAPPALSMTDMMAGDPTLLLASPTAAGMFKHLLPSYASPPPSLAASSSASASASTATATATASATAPAAAASPTMLLSMPSGTTNVKEMTLNELRPHFNKPMAVVAKELGVCITLMKKICRRNGLVRWPHRRIRSLVNRITSLQVIAASAAGAEKKRFQAQIAALREELSAVIQNPNEKSRKAQADARARSPSRLLAHAGAGAGAEVEAEAEASLSAMLQDCGGGFGALGGDDRRGLGIGLGLGLGLGHEPADAAAEGFEPARAARPSSATSKKAKKKAKGKKKKPGKRSSEPRARREDSTGAAAEPEDEDESPRAVSASLAPPPPSQAAEVAAPAVETRASRKRKRLGARFGGAFPPPPIKIPRLEDAPARARCHSAPERRARDRKVLRGAGGSGGGGADTGGASPRRASCVRPATTTNRGKRGSISSILCHAVDQV